MCTSVGIMHEGHLLKSGAIDSVLSSIESERIEIEIEVLEVAEAAADLLGEQENVDSIRIDGMKLRVSFTGDGRARADLLRLLVNEGIGVSSFRPGRSGIESLLMDLIDE